MEMGKHVIVSLNSSHQSKMKHIIIYNHDIQKYPPILSAINFLLQEKEEVVVLGYCSNQNTIDQIRLNGAKFYETVVNDTTASKLSKIFNLFSYKRIVSQIVDKIADDKSLLWIYGNQNSWMLHELVYKYKSILYLFEIPRFKVSLRYKLLSPLLNYKKMMQHAFKVVCCEYNRAHITRAYFDLKEVPVVIPNKPDYKILKEVDVEVSKIIAKLPQGKKIILYQGIFNFPERRLEELCQAIDFLPEDYIICLMGGDDKNKLRLVDKYKSNRVIFLPFVSAPNHLAITQKAHIGFLTYFPTEGILESCLNTLYCAPNKIYEYSNFGIPMISNDVPALKLQFDQFQAGISLVEFSPKKIAKAILEIEDDYISYSKGSQELFESIEIEKLYSKLCN